MSRHYREKCKSIKGEGFEVSLAPFELIRKAYTHFV